jgi:hypothetical protein
MPKAALTLPNGTVVQIEGSTEEVKEFLDFYRKTGTPHMPGGPVRSKGGGKATRAKRKVERPAAEGNAATNLTEIVNHVKNCDEAEKIERQILDRSSQVDRTLLPLYVVHEYLGNAFGLSSGEIAKITTDLGVPVSQPNASKTLSGTAAKYVIGDRVRKKGQSVRYKLSRRGVQYMKSVIGETSDENST